MDEIFGQKYRGACSSPVLRGHKYLNIDFFSTMQLYFMSHFGFLLYLKYGSSLKRHDNLFRRLCQGVTIFFFDYRIIYKLRFIFLIVIVIVIVIVIEIVNLLTCGAGCMSEAKQDWTNT